MKQTHFIALAGSLVLLAVVAGCKDNKPTSTGVSVPADATKPASAPHAASPGAPQASAYSGTVAETMNTGGYTYVQIDTGKEKIWAAAPQFKVAVGEKVAIRDAMPMFNYHSPTLNRDFPVVYFTGNVAIGNAQPAAAGKSAEAPGGLGLLSAQGSGVPAGHPPIGGDAAKPAVDLSGVKKADGGMTIAEIFTGKATLTGKEVKVRGKVVKYNANIMGKNWLHIQDGTGAAGGNDLLLTSASAVKVGDTVLATGTILTDKDFGYGYKYSLMIDNAKVVVE